MTSPAGKGVSPSMARTGLVFWIALAAGLAGAFVGGVAMAGADELELVSGKRYQGKLISRDASYVTFEAITGSGTAKLTFPARIVKSITIGPIPKPPDKPKDPPKEGKPDQKPKGPDDPGPKRGPTRAEVEAMIRKAAANPEWWDSVEMKHPQTLDLAGTARVKGWRPARKLGAYVYSSSNPNPGKWRSTIKLFRHVIDVRKNDKVRQRQAMATLGRLYFTYEKDYARTVYWYRRAAAGQRRIMVLPLVMEARCYGRLGAKTMAKQTLAKLGPNGAGFSGAIQLLGEIGEAKRAFAMAELQARRAPAAAYLVAGEAARYMGDFKQARTYFEKVLAARKGPRKGRYVKKHQQTARDCIAAVTAFDGLDLAALPDGAYQASARGYRSDLQVEVRIAGGKIAAVRVVRQNETFSLGGVTDVPKQILANQSIKGVDTVTCATVTAQAIINAAGKAIGKAKGAK